MMTKIRRNTAVFVLLILSVAGIVLSVFYYRSSIEQLEMQKFKESVRDQTSIRLENTSSYISLLVNDLRETADMIEAYDTIWDDEVSNILKIANQLDSFTFTSVVDSTGNGYSNIGTKINVAEREYFQTVMTGTVAFSEVYPSQALPGRYVQIFACPIWDEDHQVKGAVLGVIDLEHINEAIRKKYMKTDGNLYIVDSNGNYIGIFQLETDDSEYQNFWEDLEALTDIDKDISQIKEDFAQRQEGEFSYSENGHNRYGYYMPIGTRNWQVVYTMEDTSVGETLNSLFRMDTRYTLFLSTCYLIWVICVALYFRKANKEIQQAHQEVSNNLEILHIALEYSKQPIFEYDQKCRELKLKTDFPNPLFQGISESMTPESFVEQQIIAQNSVGDFMDLFAAIRTQSSATADIQVNNGLDVTWCRLSLHNVYESRKIVGTVGFLEDITELKKIEQQSKRKQELQDALIAKALLIAKVDLETERLLERNGKELQIPYTRFLEEEIIKWVRPNDREFVVKELSLENIRSKFHQGMDTIDTHFLMEQEGGFRWVSCIGYCHPTKPTRMILIFKDIDRQKRKEIALRQQAERDGLTGLYNAATARKKIEEALAYGYLSEEKQVFILFDLDNYKQINDTFGHICGNQVLVDVAQMMQKRFRSSDIIGRVGGDEFVVFLRNITSYQYAESLIQELCDMIHKTYIQDGKEVTLSASVGVTWAPVDGHTFTELYQKSDIALYQVKRNTKNGYKHYEEDQQAEQMQQS